MYWLPLLAGVEFVAVFAGAANTSIASTLMAMELFWAEVEFTPAVACVVSYLFSVTPAFTALSASATPSIAMCQKAYDWASCPLTARPVAARRNSPSIPTGKPRDRSMNDDVSALRLYFPLSSPRAPRLLDSVMTKSLDTMVAGLPQISTCVPSSIT
jgi:hypothetical protein